MGSQGLEGHFKSYLIIAFTGRAVAKGVRSFPERNFNMLFRYHRPCERGARR